MRSFIAKKEVHAPFDGQLGIREVNVGQMINAGQQVVALTALNPVYVDFALPQQNLPNLAEGLEVRVHSDAMPDEKFEGKLTAINSMVDPVTRNVTLQATLDNPQTRSAARHVCEGGRYPAREKAHSHRSGTRHFLRAFWRLRLT